MSNTALDSKSFNTTYWFGARDALHDLIAAMPIVIFAKALRGAFQRPAAATDLRVELIQR
jgi:hypothetical protein